VTLAETRVLNLRMSAQMTLDRRAKNALSDAVNDPKLREAGEEGPIETLVDRANRLLDFHTPEVDLE